MGGRGGRQGIKTGPKSRRPSELNCAPLLTSPEVSKRRGGGQAIAESASDDWKGLCVCVCADVRIFTFEKSECRAVVLVGELMMRARASVCVASKGTGPGGFKSKPG